MLDTTVLLYAVGDDHPLKQPSRRLVDAIGSGVAATTTVEVIQELVHVRSQRRTRRDGRELGDRFARMLAPLLSTTAADLATGLAMFVDHPRLGAFDAVLAATALRYETEAFVSADRAFADVPGLQHVAPGTPEFDALLI